jgi:hypothetical protein
MGGATVTPTAPESIYILVLATVTVAVIDIAIIVATNMIVIAADSGR